MTIDYIDLRKKNYIQEHRQKRAKNTANTVCSIKTEFGWRTMDSPYDPLGEARQIIAKNLSPESRLLLVGVGSGFIAEEFIRQGISDAVLITGSPVLGRKNFDMFAEYKLRQLNIKVIVASVLCDSLISHIDDFCAVKSALKVIIHPRETKAFPLLFNPISIYIQSVIYPILRKPFNPPKRVLFPTSGQLLEPEIYKELAAREIDVIAVESFAGKNISPIKAWEVVKQSEPDLVLSTNNKGSDPMGLIPDACAQAGVPWATWFLDQPRFIISQKEIGQRQKRFGFCWDISGVEACKDLRFAKIKLLPLATDPAIFSPGKGIDGLSGRIVYVGSPSFGNEDKYFAGIKADPKAQLVAKSFEKNILQTRKLPSCEDINDIVDTLGIGKNYFSAEALRRLPAFTLYRANLRYRIKALSALAGLNPIVYGDGWGGLLPEAVELRSYVDYYRDLVGIYRSDAVHISLTHLQMRLYPNQRIFDVGACGRIVLGDMLEGWKDLFGNEFDDLVFNDFNELRAKAAALAQQKQKRKMLGEMLRCLILKRHTISHRIDSMFDAIKIT